MSLTPQRQIRPKVLGPCFTCGAFGHLAASCPLKGKQYPFGQPVVSSAEVTSVLSEYSELSMCVRGADSGTAESCVPLQCVNDSQSMVDVWDTSEVVDTYPSDGLLVDMARMGGGSASNFEPNLRCPRKAQTKNTVLARGPACPPPILDCIENGYRLPLKFVPPPFSQPNHQSSQLHCEFVNEAVKSLILNRCVMKVQSKPEVCSPLSVVGNPEVKLRLVLNLRHLNQFLHVQSFKYEDLRIAALMFEQGEYLFKFDLKSGYHHVDIWPEHCKYLGFR